ncbi:CBS domain-containing protein [Streptomyces erythrochromogenes]|uniref:CBS domain-containing protein n=1 Tax=Streptomyces erythrochromogenes TaxID=285574 RepID=UPI0037F8211A
MSARDLAAPYPCVTTADGADDAVRLLVAHSLPALLVLDTNGMPRAVVPVSQLVRQLVPDAAVEDPLRAAVLRDEHSAQQFAGLVGLTVAEWLPRHGFRAQCVGPDATVARIAEVMARKRTPLVPVIEHVDDDGVRMLGVVSADAVLHHLLAASSDTGTTGTPPRAPRPRPAAQHDPQLFLRTSGQGS